MATEAEDPPALAPSAADSAAGDPPTASDLPDKPRESLDKRKEKDEDEQQEEEEEEEAESRETKRRRTTRQLALEKPPPNSSASADQLSDRENGPGLQGFSFSFDTRITAPIETTPKFGSFNFSLGLAGLENNCVDDKLAQEAEQEDKHEDGEGKTGIWN